jgi:signal transduction histidine kinase
MGFPLDRNPFYDVYFTARYGIHRTASMSPFAVVLFVAAALTALVAIPAWRRRPAPGATALAALALSVALWELTSGLCVGLEPLAWKIVSAKVQYLAINGVPIAWFLFCAAYSRREEWLTPRRILLLSILPAIVVLLAATNELHHLVWSSIEPVSDRWGLRAVYHHGPAFWVIAVYHYTLLLVGSTILLRTVVRLPEAYSRQSRFLVLGLLLPWIPNILYLAGKSPLPGLDPTPFGFSLSVLLMSWALARLALLDLVPVARDVVVDRMTDGVLVLDGLGRVVDANPAARRFAANDAQLIGQPASALPWPSLAPRIAAREEGSWTLPAAETGEIQLEAQLRTLLTRRKEPAGWLVLLRDVTAQAEAIRLREELIALVSHELRTPLTAIAGALRLIAPQSPDLEPSAERMLQLAVRNTERLLRLTTDLLDLERLKADSSTVQTRAVPVDLLLRTVGEEMNPAATMAEVDLELETSSARVWADADRIVQVLVNLVGNAVKFSPPGGRVRLSAQEDTAAGIVRLTVRDSGRGIEAGDLERIFEPFEQANAGDRLARHGSGLGLAISRAIVLRHGGRIWAESTPGVGSAFHFTLPFATASEPALSLNEGSNS